MSTPPADTYTHGHQPAVVRMHAARTAGNSAAYLLPHLRPGLDVLDVGCGPGTITADFAALVDPGRVLGIDSSDDVVAQARAAVTAENLSFGVGDVYALDQPDAAFDVVHAHQVLQHLTRPVDALVEMARVLRPGGVVGVRDVDYASFVWAPRPPLLDRWLELYHQVARSNGAEPDAGRWLPAWVRRAGFVDAEVSVGSVWYADPEGARFWAEGWRARSVSSAFTEHVLAAGLSDRAELAAISDAWHDWGTAADAFLTYANTEVVARRP